MASEFSFGKKSSIVPGKRTQRGRPPKATGKEVRALGVTVAGQTAELLRLQSENEFLKGKVQLLEDHGMQRSRAWCGTPPILGVVNMVGTRNFTCYMGAL